MRLRDKVAIITGGAQGIGFACAKRFAEEGCSVVIADVNADVGQTAVAELTSDGARAAFVACDVSRSDDVNEMVRFAEKTFGRIDIGVNNAGISRPAEFLDLGEDEFDTVIAINLKATFLCGQAVARHMVSGGIHGSIINMSSINAVVAASTGAAYASSKGGVNQLTKVMAVSLAAHGIRVNAIGPGTIVTAMTGRTVLSNEESRRKILSRTPLGRCGEPSEVAGVALFLASEDSSYVTGQTIYPDGGRLALNYTVPA
jgi:NAD(P)-dependent dehydrogenase (short-subunit alcohol dehydrogenase family)